MQKIVECPACHHNGLKIEVQNGYHIQTTGKPLSQLPCIARCSVCNRSIKYDVVKDKK